MMSQEVLRGFPITSHQCQYQVIKLFSKKAKGHQLAKYSKFVELK